MGAVADRVERALEPAISGRGLDLELVDVQPAGRRRLVRVLVDRDGGISLDEVAELSHYLSEVLDESEAMGDQPYVLEVSSPGVDRPLTLPRHWRRAKGRLVDVELTEGGSIAGRVLDSTDLEFALATTSGSRTVPFSNVVRAQIEVEFTHVRAADPESGDDTAEQE
jgi:ribosome maturation factor RimP